MSLKILVTGGAGYLGSTLVPELLDLGHQVTVLDNFIYKQSSLNHVCHKSNFKVVKGDVRIESVMKPLIKDADVIIPLAALVGGGTITPLPATPFTSRGRFWTSFGSVWARNPLRMGQKPFSHGPGRRPGPFGTVFVGPFAKSFGPKPVPNRSETGPCSSKRWWCLSRR